MRVMTLHTRVCAIHDAYICGMCYYHNTAFKVNNTPGSTGAGVPADYNVPGTRVLISLSNTAAAHAPCFLEHKLCLLCYLLPACPS